MFGFIVSYITLTLYYILCIFSHTLQDIVKKNKPFTKIDIKCH